MLISEEDARWMERALEQAERCPPSATAFSVGAVIVVGGRAVAEGRSRAEQPADHAEEVALRRAAAPVAGATVYSTMEPCGRRASRPEPCARLLIEARVARVVYALAEPDRFVGDPGGARMLREAGIEVEAMTEFAAAAERPNVHLR
ncbi:deaminase [Glycomyces xiaoerkulensis]|uniref:deaminase n=1 Tax=Glycomyces xiaoerkulensis TaxID=2038139 RepID=UPI0018E402C1|nr:deaminase [Glycomyces xiaoerkulensis]